MKKDGILEKMKKDRYHSYHSGIGVKIAKGTTSFEELEKHVLQSGNPKQVRSLFVFFFFPPAI